MVGRILFYTFSVDSTFLVGLNTITIQQTSATENTLKRTEELLDYAATHPARSVDSTFLVGLNTIAIQQTSATENTLKRTEELLDYAATHPDAKIWYRASEMILQIHTDASYLSEPKA